MISQGQSTSANLPLRKRLQLQIDTSFEQVQHPVRDPLYLHQPQIQDANVNYPFLEPLKLDNNRAFQQEIHPPLADRFMCSAPDQKPFENSRENLLYSDRSREISYFEGSDLVDLSNKDPESQIHSGLDTQYLKLRKLDQTDSIHINEPQILKKIQFVVSPKAPAHSTVNQQAFHFYHAQKNSENEQEKHRISKPQQKLFMRPKGINLQGLKRQLNEAKNVINQLKMKKQQLDCKKTINYHYSNQPYALNRYNNYNQFRQTNSQRSYKPPKYEKYSSSNSKSEYGRSPEASDHKMSDRKYLGYSASQSSIVYIKWEKKKSER